MRTWVRRLLDCFDWLGLPVLQRAWLLGGREGGRGREGEREGRREGGREQKGEREGG